MTFLHTDTPWEVISSKGCILLRNETDVGCLYHVLIRIIICFNLSDRFRKKVFKVIGRIEFRGAFVENIKLTRISRNQSGKP